VCPARCPFDLPQQRFVQLGRHADAAPGQVGHHEADRTTQHLRCLGQAQPVVLLQPLRHPGGGRAQGILQRVACSWMTGSVFAAARATSAGRHVTDGPVGVKPERCPSGARVGRA